MIHLKEINQQNYQECMQLSVFESQRSYVATNVQSLAQAYIERKSVEPYAIYYNDIMVGFIMIIPDDKHDKTMYVWRLMIDQRFQGNGYGKAAMRMIIDMVKSRQTYNSLELSVEPDNHNAIIFYESLRFVMTGEIDDGESVMRLSLK